MNAQTDVIKLEVSMLVAADITNAIGFENTIPWKIKADMQRFKALTVGKTVIMGRKTAESIGRALPQRVNIVLTSQGKAPYEGQVAISNLTDALWEAMQLGKDICIIGGQQIYTQTLDADIVDVVHYTVVRGKAAQADAYFPREKLSDWFWSHDENEDHELAQHPDDTHTGVVLTYRRLPGMRSPLDASAS